MWHVMGSFRLHSHHGSKCPSSDVSLSCGPVLMFPDQCKQQKAARRHSFPVPVWTTWRCAAQSDQSAAIAGSSSMNM